MLHKQRLTYEFVRKFFEEAGCEMLDTYYKNARTHINYRCTCGNVSKIIFDSFRRGHRCSKCASIRNAKKQTLTYDYVFNYFKDRGCLLLEDKYINAQTKMKYLCSCGDIDYVRLGGFKRSKRCWRCGVKKRSGKNHYEWKEDRDAHEDGKKMKQRCYKMLRNTLKRTCQKKRDRTCKMLGYTFEQLQNHIYNHPNWKNVKNSIWHLDHIFPIKSFLDYDIKNIKLINCLDNLQPLSVKDNTKKNASYNKKEFEQWLREKQYEF
jgi:hypothetical protein